MGKSVIIVESPAKTRTIGHFVGPEYQLVASMGHIRDLPQNELGVDVANDFAPEYEPIAGKRKTLAALRKATEGVEAVYLATDPDREGEAIAWHLAELLGLKSPRRIEFNEITRSAVQAALKHPREIDMRRVGAQQARRVLDRLVGYRLSPLLWRKVKQGLSAGRVQSVAVRLICDREREIENFVPQESWSIDADLTPTDREVPLRARLVEKAGEKIKVENEQQAQAIVEELRQRSFKVAAVERKDQRRNPPPPHITSTLQQDAASRLGFSARKTMSVAQQLYEGLALGEEGSVGLITYMRTDSVRVAKEAQAEARQVIAEVFGEEYLPDRPPVYKSRRTAQEAHEAIRPTAVSRRPDDIKGYLDKDQFGLYRLIWSRFAGSQMRPAILDTIRVDVEADGYLLRATGSRVKFPGYRAAFAPTEEEEEKEREGQAELPALSPDEPLRLLDLIPEQHFTQPPPRYSEATLVKELEANGIGRPSTYAPIIQTIRARRYVYMDKRRFRPTPLAHAVTDQLVAHFPNIMEVDFTARVEDQLDAVEEGSDWVQVVRDFYQPFERLLTAAEDNMKRVRPQAETTDEICETCGKPMVVRFSRRGPFLGCSGYPACRNTKPLGDEEGGEGERRREPAQVTAEVCEKCGKPMVVRQGRRGRFLGCSGYPACRGTKPLPGEESGEGERRREPPEVTDETCEKCGKPMVVRQGRRGRFLGCSGYPACRETRPLPSPKAEAD